MGSYALGTWTTTAKQDKGIARLFNRLNADLARAATINAPGSGYAVGNVLTLADSGTPGTPALTIKYTVTSVGPAGAVTGIALVEGKNAGGNYLTHQAANNHATTVTPAGGTGCVINCNFYLDVPNMITRNKGILDNAVSSYAQQLDQEIVNDVSIALPTATDAQIANIATQLGITLPV